MPTITEAVQTGFAHCTNPRCPGHDQEEVQVVRREAAFGYDENGGNLPGFERSFVNIGFYNDGTDGKPDESVCPYCHGHREATDQARRQYESLSGHDPKGLLAVARFDAAKQAEIRRAPVSNQEREAFERERQDLAARNLDLQQRLIAIEERLAGDGKVPAPADVDPPSTEDIKKGPPPAQWDDVDAHKEALAAAAQAEAERELNGLRNIAETEGTVAGGVPEPESTGLTEEEATAALAQMTPEERASIQAALANLQISEAELEDPRGSE